MDFSTLITQYDQRNHVTTLLSEKYNCNQIIFLYFKDEEYYLKKFIENNSILKKMELILKDIDNISYDEMLNAIESEYSQNTIINLTGGSRVISLMLHNISLKLNINCVYVDLLNKKRYVFNNDFRIINQSLDDLLLEDYLSLAGAKLSEDSTLFSKKEDIKEFTLAIHRNMDCWERNKKRLYDTSTFIHDYKNSTSLTINEDKLTQDEKRILDKILNKFKSLGEIDFKIDDKINVIFKNNYLKSFVFKSGTWLEVLTSMVVSEIPGVDDVKSGVMFYWGEETDKVRNELDVVAIKDSVLICISCKDSNKYNEQALNELFVYSERLGGKDVVKILVATKEPFKGTVLSRAKEMGIHIVVLGKDINHFKTQLSKIICDKK